jgi:hypothetical protein
MTLKTQMATDLAVFFNSSEFAESVTYAGTAITAVVMPGQAIEAGGSMTAERTVKRATLFVKASDVAAPAYRDAVVIDGDTWHVIQIPGEDEGVWELIETMICP